MQPQDYRDDFLLAPGLVYLNHAAYGATPRPVFESYQRWQRRLESDPVDFISRNGEPRLAAARAELARFVGAERDDLVYVTNATVGMNIVARSLPLGPGDEVLATAHEHGGIERMWKWLAERQGFTYRVGETHLPLTDHAEFVEEFWTAVGPATRVITMSHIASPTSVILPVVEICRRARAAGILTVIDGAHAPGQIPVAVDDLGADFYVALTHKWVCAPKGTGFLHARRESQPLLEPLVASWGVDPMMPNPSQFVDHHEWQGSRDFSGFLAVPDAIAYQRDPNWPQATAASRRLAREAHAALVELIDIPPYNPATDEWNAQMITVPLPEHVDPRAMQLELFERDHIEVCVSLQGKPKLRVSLQVYNDWSDVEALLAALRRLL